MVLDFLKSYLKKNPPAFTQKKRKPGKPAHRFRPGAEIRAYQQDLLARQVSWSQFNQAVCALRFLYHVTLGRPEVITHLPFAKRPRTLPTVLSPEEVTRLLTAALPGRERTLLDVAYSCGLRLKELLGLQVRDIDSARMVLHIRLGKGQKQRFVPLSPRLLEVLRGYWKEYRPATWLFPGVQPGLPFDRRCCAASLPTNGKAGRAEQACDAAHATAQLRHALAGGGGRSAERAGAVGAQSLPHDGEVPAREHAPLAAVAAIARRAGAAGTADAAGDGGTSMTVPVGFERPAVEVADVIREHGEAFRAKFGSFLGPTERKALRDLARCRTAALGGHVEHCLDCGHERIAYNSCRNSAGGKTRVCHRQAAADRIALVRDRPAETP